MSYVLVLSRIHITYRQPQASPGRHQASVADGLFEGHFLGFAACQLNPKKRPRAYDADAGASMSALPSEADITEAREHVR